MPAIEIRDLTVRSGPYPVVEKLTLDIDEGETVAISGPLPLARILLHTLSGLVAPFSGSVLIYHQPPRQALFRGLVQLIEGPQSSFVLPSTPVVLLWNLFPTPPIPAHQTLIFCPPFIDHSRMNIVNINKWIRLKEP
ncbi:MAG: hypothetical protein NZ959_11775 [Armatimonadetes bacterium]|nr:hypothetical protein [Armatimonadota bacterium]MDW8122993.1 hypothetical protein [Armatimonadota bacterium]